MSLLGPEEADRYRSSGGVGSDKSPSRAAEWLLSRVLLRTTLAKYCQPYVAPQDLRFQRGAHGKPYLLGPADVRRASALTFNLTHSDRAIGCAVSLCRQVGLDSELAQRRTRVDPLQLARRRFSVTEVMHLEGIEAAEGRSAAERRFIEMWTMKEAYVKASGKGINAPPGLKGFSIVTPSAEGLQDRLCAFRFLGTEASPPRTVHMDSQDGLSWKLLLFSPRPNHLASLCVESLAPREVVSIQSFEAKPLQSDDEDLDLTILAGSEV